MRVTVECCLQEASWNPYYHRLLARVCRAAKSHRYTLQYCLWDHIKVCRTAACSNSTRPCVQQNVACTWACHALLWCTPVLQLADVELRVMHGCCALEVRCASAVSAVCCVQYLTRCDRLLVECALADV